MAWLAVLFAAACATVSYSELRSGGWLAALPAEAEAVAEASPAGGPAPDASGDWPDPLVALYETRADAARPIRLRFSIVDPRAAASRARPSKPKPIGTVVDASPAPRLEPASLRTPAAAPAPAVLPRWPSRPATLPPGAMVAAAPRPAPPAPRPDAPAPRTNAPALNAAAPAVVSAPAEKTATPAVAALVDPSPGDEERIRTTLARLGTAYSKLDASAARAVWPSVDVRALERAFDGLKSQQLRFDRCNFTVDGARARAECTGRAVFVPRIGNQSPRSTSREWTFELKKADERWTIASASSS